jgi:AraC-like DNA-binding protein
MSFGLADILFVVVIFQLLFTTVFLYTYRKGRRVSNGLLGTFFLVMGLNLTDNFLLLKGVYTGHSEFALWSIWLLLLFGPLLYLYTQSVLFKDFRFRWRMAGHFLPFAVLFVVTEIYWLSRGAVGRRLLLESVATRQGPSYQYLDSVLIFLQFFLYMVGSFRLVGRYRKEAGQAFSDYRRIDIRWLSYTLLFFTVAMGLAAVNSVIGLTSLAEYWWPVFLLVVLLVWVYVNGLLFRALKQPELFAVLETGDGEQADDGAVVGGVRVGSNVTASGTSAADGRSGAVFGAAAGAGVRGEASGGAGGEDWRSEIGRVRGHMDAQKPWLDPDLTLEQLAGQLRMRPKLLSQAINEGAGQNFFEFVNTYRIGEARRLLTNPVDKKITVLEVLYEVGFNSKSSFNTVFKKQTGYTPSEFKKRNAG